MEYKIPMQRDSGNIEECAKGELCAMQPHEEQINEAYIDALEYVVKKGVASISHLQRGCQMGYNRAGKVIEWMEEQGYISPFDSANPRKVLITKEEFEEKYGDL